MVDEGFRRDDPRYEMAQISEALTRICRLISGIRLHTGEWTVDQSATFFEEMARGAAFNLREFNERVMTNGIAPRWAHRQLLLPGDTSPVLP